MKKDFKSIYHWFTHKLPAVTPIFALLVTYNSFLRSHFDYVDKVCSKVYLFVHQKL